MSEFDSKALASAREVMALTRQEHIGGDAQLLAKIQLLFVEAMEYAAPQLFGNSEQLNSPVTPDGWIKCSERMPAPQELIYIYHPDYGVDGDVWYEEYAGEFKWGDDTRGRDISTVTHWMEMPGLPAAPKQESE